jgi:hypothetical protein
VYFFKYFSKVVEVVLLEKTTHIIESLLSSKAKTVQYVNEKLKSAVSRT